MQAMTRLTLAAAALLSSTAWAAQAPIQPKVVLITMFAPRRSTGSSASICNRKSACRACPPSTRPCAATHNRCAC